MKKYQRETRPRGKTQYHIQWCEPSDVWPKGGWSLYCITGDEIASRVVWKEIDPRGWYIGKPEWRHPWCGYVGMWETWAEVGEAIEKHSAEMVTYVTEAK